MRKNIFPIVSDVISHNDEFRVVNHRGELTGIRPRCGWCHFATETPGGNIRCRMGVSQYADARRKRPVDETRARTWSAPESDMPYITEKDIGKGDNGMYTITLEQFSRGGAATPTIREVIENVCSHEKDPDLAVTAVIKEVRLTHAFSADELDEVDRLVRVTLGVTEDLMDVGERVTLPEGVEKKLDDMDEFEITDIAKRRNKAEPKLFTEAMAYRNYTPAIRYKAKPRRCFNPATSEFDWAEEREYVPFSDPGFSMPMDPGPISVHVRCFPNVDYILCPLASGKIPMKMHQDESGNRSWGPDVDKIRGILEDPHPDPEQVEAIVMYYQDRIHSVVRKTTNPRVLNIIRKKFGWQASIRDALKGKRWNIK